MKLLLVCEYWYGTGGWSYKGYLEQLGCEVRVFDFRQPFFTTGKKKASIFSMSASNWAWS